MDHPTDSNIASNRPVLTKKQRRVLQFIADHIKKEGYPPTLREVSEHMGIRSINGANDHLKALERKGYISRGRFKSRAVRVLDPSPASEMGSPLAQPKMARA